MLILNDAVEAWDTWLQDVTGRHPPGWNAPALTVEVECSLSLRTRETHAPLISGQAKRRRVLSQKRHAVCQLSSREPLDPCRPGVLILGKSIRLHELKRARD